jgi:DNA repair protein RadC
MMQKNKKQIDVIGKVLQALYEHDTDSLFVMSLMHQYEERGSLSKKQLEGLCAKAKKVDNLPVAWIGTIEAIILKMPTRYKSTLEKNTPVFKKNEEATELITAILANYPQHKRVLFLQAKNNNHEPITGAEVDELRKFHQLLIKKKA